MLWVLLQLSARTIMTCPLSSCSRTAADKWQTRGNLIWKHESSHRARQQMLPGRAAGRAPAHLAFTKRVRLEAVPAFNRQITASPQRGLVTWPIRLWAPTSDYHSRGNRPAQLWVVIPVTRQAAINGKVLPSSRATPLTVGKHFWELN